jgi:hypothetical protein
VFDDGATFYVAPFLCCTKVCYFLPFISSFMLICFIRRSSVHMVAGTLGGERFVKW